MSYNIKLLLVIRQQQITFALFLAKNGIGRSGSRLRKPSFVAACFFDAMHKKYHHYNHFLYTRSKLQCAECSKFHLHKSSRQVLYKRLIMHLAIYLCGRNFLMSQNFLHCRYRHTVVYQGCGASMP